MEKIEKFEIQLDLTDCELVYDYVTKEEIRRPTSGVWSPLLLEGKGSLKPIPVNDEAERTRISLMDNCIMDTVFMEKKVVENKVKEASPSSPPKDEADEKADDAKDARPLKATDFPSTDDLIFGNPEDIDNHLPRRLLPVYKPGDKVKGHVILKLNDALGAEAFKLNFVGQTAVNVRFYKKSEQKDNTQYEKFANETRVLWARTSDSGRSQTSDKYSLLDTPESPSAFCTEMEAGEHKFYFDFDIPEDAPQSIPPLVISSVNFAHLVWRLKAKIHMGSFFKVGNISTHRGLWVAREYDIATMTDSLLPVIVEESVDTGIMPFKKGGKLKCKASIPRAAHVRGHSVQLKLEVDNQSKGEISKVQAYIRLQGRARLSDQKLSLSNKIHLKSEHAIEGPVGAGMCPTYEWTLPWDWSDSSADGRWLPVGQLEESKLIDFKYEVVVKLSRKGLHRTMELCLPLTVGSYDSGASRELMEGFREALETHEENRDEEHWLEEKAELGGTRDLFPPLSDFA
ncbi:hypothetical protein CAPTEDRAFT_215174 [Capitella teleta]|uniref:Arrestin C-terminal-like domain-containing protein n=1 Tax=Capitella teleta TaxID=283909 RepID=R7UWJ0_CAPTE|nr:hypothetical protein CAPTEDRAFT_215174 [Capitella teleta]|eukprot:ELU10637.1 hypothetical protein CAPTEDRAFT_215174 [Capitella teleta]